MDSIALPAVNDTPQADLTVTNPEASQAQGQEQQGQLTADQQAQQQAEQEQWFLEAETGTRYKTAEDARIGIAVKDRVIEQYKEMFGSLGKAPQVQPQSATDPQAAFEAEIAQIAKAQEQRLMQNPRWREAGHEAIREQAELNAYSIYDARELARQEIRQEREETAQLRFMEQNRDLLSRPEAQRLWDASVAAGRPFQTAQEHAQAILAEIGRQTLYGQPAQQPAPAYQGVTAAIAQQQQRGQIFQGSGQGTTQPQQPQIPAHLQQEAEWARSKGYSEEQIQAVLKSKLGTGANQ